MPRPYRPASLLILGLALVALAGCGSSSHHATVPSTSDRGIESILQDDQYLLDQPDAAVVARTLGTAAALGVDTVRVNVIWASLAPDPLAGRPPAGFRADDPAAYPAASWGPYDRLVALAHADGLRVYFTVTVPGPLWAMARGPLALADRLYPSPARFGAFVRALGRRYSGNYRPRGARAPLPRVAMWSVWNEPNQPGWLAPQWQFRSGRRLLLSPRLYRGLLDAAWDGLHATGHAGDTILIGELAPEGCLTTSGAGCSYPPTLEPIPPLDFVRGLYCLDGRDAPLTGAPATALGCPTGGGRAGFVSAHPGLFEATGFAHHPYSFFQPPGVPLPEPDFVPLANLSRLERVLDRAFAAYGVSRTLPIYITEFGEATDPPNPFRGFPLAAQAAYLDQAQYMAWSDPRVRAMAQFLLYDSPPDTAFPRGSLRYWSTFQTGLSFSDGRPKPAFFGYRIPIYLPGGRPLRGDRVAVSPGPVLVWGMLRSAPNGTRQTAQIQWRSAQGGFRTLAAVSTSNPTGVVEALVTFPASGYVRIAWRGPAGVEYSRSVSIVVL